MNSGKSDGLKVFDIFSVFKKHVEKINVWPLVLDNLHIQEDALKRMAEDDIVDDYPFATLECGKKEKDSDLRFIIQFFREYFTLEIEGGIELVNPYSSNDFKDENDAAQQIINILSMLASGQLYVIQSMRYGVPCAIELVLEHSSEYRVLHFKTEYSFWWRAKDFDGYEAEILKNHYLLPRVKADSFFLLERDGHGKLLKTGRVSTPPLMSPLTKGEFKRLDDEIVWSEIGRPDLLDNEQNLLRQWENIPVILFTALLFYVLYLVKLLPPTFADHIGLLAIPFLFIDSFLMSLVLKSKERVRIENPNSLWFKLDLFFSFKFFGRIFYTLLILSTILMFFIPAIYLKDSHHLTTMFHLAMRYPFCYLVLPLLALSLLLLFSGSRLRRFIGFGSYFISTISLNVINFALTNTDIEVPEPYNSFAIVVSLVGFFVTLFVLLSYIPRRHTTSIRT